MKERGRVRKGGKKKDVKDREKEMKDREIREREEGYWGLPGRQGSLALHLDGIRSGGSTLLSPRVFSWAETAGGWGGGGGEEGSGGSWLGGVSGGSGDTRGTGQGSSYLRLRPALPGRRTLDEARPGSRRLPAPARQPSSFLRSLPLGLLPPSLASQAQPAAH